MAKRNCRSMPLPQPPRGNWSERAGRARTELSEAEAQARDCRQGSRKLLELKDLCYASTAATVAAVVPVRFRLRIRPACGVGTTSSTPAFPDLRRTPTQPGGAMAAGNQDLPTRPPRNGIYPNSYCHRSPHPACRVRAVGRRGSRHAGVELVEVKDLPKEGNKPRPGPNPWPGLLHSIGFLVSVLTRPEVVQQ
jgi:hypothetical protein